jgi:ABC-type phosphate transport system substrate-binding protein
MTKRLLFFLATVTTVFFAHTMAHAGIAVIGGSSFPKDALSIGEVKEIYTGKMEIVGGTRLKPLDQKSSVKSDFVEKAVGMSEDDYKSYWIKRVFREGGSPPAVKASSDDVISAVKEDKGAVGYVSEDEAKGKSGIRVLLVIK